MRHSFRSARAPLAFAFLSVALAACGGSDAADGKATAATSGEGKTDNGAVSSKLAADRAREGALGDMTIGDPDAPVTLVEYASYTCGHCANFHINILPTIKEKYVETGQVAFIFRELPTPPQELSYIGSVLARCAADKGGDAAYFAVGDSLFRRQMQWAFGDDPKLELQKITNQAGMDGAAMAECLQRNEILEVINANIEEANEVFKITGTPNFLINGEKVTLKTFADLEKLLDKAVTEAGLTPVNATEEAAAAQTGENSEG